MENRCSGDRKHCFVNFFSLGVLESPVDEGWWDGAESLNLGQLKSHLFPAGISAEPISMTNVVSAGYFYFLFL